MIPTGRLSPQALAILNLLPMPNAPGTVNGTRDNFIAQGSEKFNSDAFNVRADGRLDSRLNVFAAPSYAKFAKDRPWAFSGAGRSARCRGGPRRQHRVAAEAWPWASTTRSRPRPFLDVHFAGSATT